MTVAQGGATRIGVREAVERAAAVARAAGERWLLAVSGGRDSMVLLDAAREHAADRVAAVASFDHGTGEAAADAARLVERIAGDAGFPIVLGRAELPDGTEQAWRAARWRFLNDVARARGARVATAHTRDDAVETILMRIMRGAGARGLAALHAPGPVARPLLDVGRDEMARHAREHELRWIEDPSNQSLRFFRNRVRHEILPALIAARPALAEELLDLSRRAAALRRELAAVVDAMEPRLEEGALVVAAGPLADYDAESLRLLWGEIAARAGIVLDARGTAGLARFTIASRGGDRMQLSGAIDVLRRREAIVLTPVVKGEAAPAPQELPSGIALEWGRWRFRPSADGEARVARQGADAWASVLPAKGRLRVRAWRPGDRMHGAGDAAPRRVKRFLRDAGLVGPERAGWPVVLDGDEVVWIPGVRRSDAATVRSGGPGAVYRCERIEPAREG
jgi:tRNA(Ile)-lysidine synthase